MHDLRANEYASKLAKENKAKAKAMNEKFKAKNKEYKCLEFEKGKYCVVIPNCVNDLKKEGSKLHHCVGKMGYDNKVVTGQSIIAFVRIADDPIKPFVTVEYSLKANRVAQCYGDHDSKPAEEVRKFVDKWESFVRKELKKA